MQVSMAVSSLIGYSPVRDANGGVHGEKSQKFLVKDFIDAPLPCQEQLGKAAKASVRHTSCVRHGHLGGSQLSTAVLLQGTCLKCTHSLFCRVFSERLTVTSVSEVNVKKPSCI